MKPFSLLILLLLLATGPSGARPVDYSVLLQHKVPTCGIVREGYRHDTASPPLRFDTEPTRSSVKKSFWSSRFYRMTYVGLPLLVGGAIVKSEDDRFRSLRNHYLPVFRHHYDDYLQYSPAAAMLVLKAAGVKGRSSWGRMLSSDAFSVAIMAGVVNTLKHTISVMRPDGSNNHSFPSGHTATAFMTATMLSKEYGAHSPWISAGAYSVAAATGLSRMVNNKHWLSDVLVGAGIGILSVELGYFLADLIFKDKGIADGWETDEPAFTPNYKPSFLGIYLGINLPLSSYDLGRGVSMKTSSGSHAGLEGAWFMTPYFGIGGRLTLSNIAFRLNGIEVPDESLGFVTTNLGMYFSYPLSRYWLVGGKALLGYTHYTKTELPQITIGQGGMGFGWGLSFTFRAQRNYNMRFFLDHDVIPPCTAGGTAYMHTMALGTALSIAF